MLRSIASLWFLSAGIVAAAPHQITRFWALGTIPQKNSCVIFGRLEDGLTEVSIVVPRDYPTEVVLMLKNPNWKSLVQGETHPVEIQLNFKSIGYFKGYVPRGAENQISTPLPLSAIDDAFRRNSTVSVSTNGRELARLHLSEQLAWTAVTQCAGTALDPFAK